MAPSEKGKKGDVSKENKKNAGEEKSKAADEKAKNKVSAEPTEANDEAASPESKLSVLRPRRRLVFFLAFVGFCGWLVVNFDPCKSVNKKGKDKQDCGWEGVSPLTCVTTACFQKSPKLAKQTIKVKRSKGAKLGLGVAEGTDSKWLTVSSISDGAIKEYNDKLPADSEERILPGDSIWKVGDAKGKKMSKAVTAAAASEDTVSIEIGRSNLPSWLLFLHNPAEMSLFEKALTSKGFERWSRSFAMLGGGSFSCWFFSGYPLASLPMYLGISTLTAWHTTRCCHDEKVPAGQPHCFFGGAKLEAVVKKAWVKTRDIALKVRENPKSYVDWLLYGK